MWLNLTERYPIDIVLMHNLKEKEYRSLPDMFEIVESSQATDFVHNIDPFTNIIICTNSLDNILTRTKLGTISIKTHYNMNLSGSRTIDSNTIVAEFFPRLKIAVPKGLKINFSEPFGSIYHSKIFKTMDIIDRKKSDDKIPNYFIYQNLAFTVYVDLNQLKKTNGTIFIPQYTDFIEFDIAPTYYIGHHLFPIVEKIYWIKNDEIFKTFDTIF